MDFAQFQVCFPGASQAIEELQTKLKDSDTKAEEQTKTTEEWTQKFAELETSNSDLKTQLDEKQKLIEDFDSRLKFIEDDVDVKTMKEKVAKNEEELPKVLDSVVAFQKEMGEYQERMAEALQKANQTTQKTDEYGDILRQFDIKWKTMSESHVEYGAKIAAFEAELATISNTQKEVQEMVTDKYDTLWAEVTKALGDINTQHVQEVQKELEKRNDQLTTESKNLVSYALEIMAKISAERKISTQRQSLLLAWKNQSWITQRQRLGFLSLQRQLTRRQRDAFTRWRIDKNIKSLAADLREEYSTKIPNVEEIVNTTGIPKHIEDLQQVTSELKENIGALQGADKTFEIAHAGFEDKLCSLEDIFSRLKSHDTDFIEIAQQRDLATTKIDSVISDTTAFSQKLDNMEERLSKDVAHTNEVQGMMKDVLLIWNSIKQLDAAKADKKEIDAIALENSNRDKIQMRDIEELRKCTSNLGNDAQVADLGRHYVDLATKVEENSTQFRTLQNMLSSLASFVEELVGKIAENQGIDAARLSSVRTGGGYRVEPQRKEQYAWPIEGSRTPEERGRTPEERRMPEERGRMPEERGYDDDDSYQRGMDKWLKYAKGIVDATIDGAVGPRSARPRSSHPRQDEERDVGGVSGIRIPGIPVGTRSGNWRGTSQGSMRKASSKVGTRHP